MSATTTAASLEHVIGPEGLFVLNVRDGTVRLRGTDGDAVRVTDSDGDPADHFLVERGEGSLALRAVKGLRIRVGKGHGSGRSRLEVQVPRMATLVVESTRADVTGEDVAGEQRYQTVSGDIDLDRVRGLVTIDAVSGDVRLNASGALRLRARTVSGDLAARAGRLDETIIATTSGDVSIAGELTPDGDHRIETVSGDTLLALVGGARIELSTVTGDIDANVPHRTEGGRDRRVLIVGDGRARLSARSMSGDVRIVRPRPFESGPDGAAEPVSPAPPAPPAEPGSTPSRDPSDAAIAAAYEEARLGILRSLERGEIDVVEAGRRLEALDTADVPGSDTDV